MTWYVCVFGSGCFLRWSLFAGRRPSSFKNFLNPNVCLPSPRLTHTHTSKHPTPHIVRTLSTQIKTDCHGKLFVVQSLLPNLQRVCDMEDNKPRVFSIGAPFSEGPKPDGNYMVIPGWAGFGVAKAAATWAHAGMKAEMSGTATFGYGHPGFTKTPLIHQAMTDFSQDHMLNKMCNKRIGAGDFHTPLESARLFYAVLTSVDDADFAGTKWNIVNSYGRFGRAQGAKEISDVKAGIKVPEANGAAGEQKE
jgi:hypothetical protein